MFSFLFLSLNRLIVFCGNLERGLDYQLFLQHASRLIIISGSIFSKQLMKLLPNNEQCDNPASTLEIQIKFTLIDCSYQSWKVTLSPYDTEAQSPAWILILFSRELQITLFRSVHTDKILPQTSVSQ